MPDNNPMSSTPKVRAPAIKAQPYLQRLWRSVKSTVREYRYVILAGFILFLLTAASACTGAFFMAKSSAATSKNDMRTRALELSRLLRSEFEEMLLPVTMLEPIVLAQPLLLSSYNYVDKSTVQVVSGTEDPEFQNQIEREQGGRHFSKVSLPQNISQEFRRICDKVLSAQQLSLDFIVFQLEPLGIIAAEYWLEPGWAASAIGLEIMHLPDYQDRGLTSASQNLISFSTGIDFGPGKIAHVIRNPIFVPDNQGQGGTKYGVRTEDLRGVEAEVLKGKRLWGFVSSLLNIEGNLYLSDLLSRMREQYHFRIERIVPPGLDGSGPSGPNSNSTEVWTQSYDSPAPFKEAEAVRVEFVILREIWVLVIYPHGGYQPYWFWPLISAGICAAFGSALIYILGAISVGKREHLRRRLRVRLISQGLLALDPTRDLKHIMDLQQELPKGLENDYCIWGQIIGSESSTQNTKTFTVLRVIGDSVQPNTKQVLQVIKPSLLNSRRTFAHSDCNKLNQEAHQISQIRSPFIVRLNAHRPSEDRMGYWLLMHHLGGRTMAEIVQEDESILEEDLCHMAEDVLSGLCSLHQQGISHKQLSPQAIMRCLDSKDIRFRYVIIQLAAAVQSGLTKATTTADKGRWRRDRLVQSRSEPGSGVFGFGSSGSAFREAESRYPEYFVDLNEYSSPELITASGSLASKSKPDPGMKVDQRTDLWSLGAILLHLASGLPPFPLRRDQSMESMYANIADLSRASPTLATRKSNPEYGPGLEAVVNRCLRKDRNERFQSAEEVKSQVLKIQVAKKEKEYTVQLGYRRESPYDTFLARAFFEELHNTVTPAGRHRVTVFLRQQSEEEDLSLGLGHSAIYCPILSYHSTAPWAGDQVKEIAEVSPLGLERLRGFPGEREDESLKDCLCALSLLKTRHEAKGLRLRKVLPILVGKVHKNREGMISMSDFFRDGSNGGGGSYPERVSLRSAEAAEVVMREQFGLEVGPYVREISVNSAVSSLLKLQGVGLWSFMSEAERKGSQSSHASTTHGNREFGLGVEMASKRATVEARPVRATSNIGMVEDEDASRAAERAFLRGLVRAAARRILNVVDDVMSQNPVSPLSPLSPLNRLASAEEQIDRFLPPTALATSAIEGGGGRAGVASEVRMAGANSGMEVASLSSFIGPTSPGAHNYWPKLQSPETEWPKAVEAGHQLPQHPASDSVVIEDRRVESDAVEISVPNIRISFEHPQCVKPSPSPVSLESMQLVEDHSVRSAKTVASSKKMSLQGEMPLWRPASPSAPASPVSRTGRSRDSVVSVGSPGPRLNSHAFVREESMDSAWSAQHSTYSEQSSVFRALPSLPRGNFQLWATSISHIIGSLLLFCSLSAMSVSILWAKANTDRLAARADVRRKATDLGLNLAKSVEYAMIPNFVLQASLPYMDNIMQLYPLVDQAPMSEYLDHFRVLPDFPEQSIMDFEQTTTQILAERDEIAGLMSILLEPIAVVALAVPPSIWKDSDAFGLDLLHHPERVGPYTEFFLKGDSAVFGPARLIENRNREALLGATPIYVSNNRSGTVGRSVTLKDSAESRIWWGYVESILDLKLLLEASGIAGLVEERFYFNLTRVTAFDGQGAKTSTTVVVANSGDQHTVTDGESAEFQILQETWVLTLEPEKGFSVDWLVLSTVFSVALSALLSLSGLRAYMAYQQSELLRREMQQLRMLQEHEELLPGVDVTDLSRLQAALPPVLRQEYCAINEGTREGQAKVYTVVKIVSGFIQEPVCCYKLVVSTSNRKVAQQIRNFAREQMQKLHSIHSPHLVALYDYQLSTDKRSLWQLIENVEGDRLSDVIRISPLTEEDALVAVGHVLLGLKELHSLGWVHGRLNARQVIRRAAPLEGGGYQYVITGLAREFWPTSSGSKKTTSPDWRYSSPEELQARTAMTRDAILRRTSAPFVPAPTCDVWSLGCLWYRMVTGTLPFKNLEGVLGESAAPSVYRHLPWQTRAMFSVRQHCDTAQVISTCLKKQPFERYATVEDVMGDLSTRPQPRKFTIFISYRVNTESLLAQMLFEQLNNVVTPDGRRVVVYLDSCRLKDGEDWEHGFSQALCNSEIMIPLISRGFTSRFSLDDSQDNSIAPPSLNRKHSLNTADSGTSDHVLKETQMALALLDHKKLLRVCPLFVGAVSQNGEMSSFSSIQPSHFPDEISPSTTKAVVEFLFEQFGLEHDVQDERWTIRNTMERISRLKGIDLSLEGDSWEELEIAHTDLSSHLERPACKWLRSSTFVLDHTNVARMGIPERSRLWAAVTSAKAKILRLVDEVLAPDP